MSTEHLYNRISSNGHVLFVIWKTERHLVRHEVLGKYSFLSANTLFITITERSFLKNNNLSKI